MCGSVLARAQEDDGLPRFAHRRGLGYDVGRPREDFFSARRARRGWDVRMGDIEDGDDIVALAESLGKWALVVSNLAAGMLTCTALVARGAELSWHVVESSHDERLLGCVATRLEGHVAVVEALMARYFRHRST